MPLRDMNKNTQQICSKHESGCLEEWEMGKVFHEINLLKKKPSRIIYLFKLHVCIDFIEIQINFLMFKIDFSFMHQSIRVKSQQIV